MTLAADDAPRVRPQSLTDLFVSFTLLSLQGFGGVQAVVQNEMVERKRWLSNEEFIDDWAIAQVVPGANMVNFTIMIGGRHFGVPGALAALAGLLAAPVALILVLALTYTQLQGHPGVTGALRGVVAVAAGIVFASGLRLVVALKKNVLTLPLCLLLSGLTFALVALLRLPLMLALIGIGGCTCAAAYARLKA